MSLIVKILINIKDFVTIDEILQKKMLKIFIILVILNISCSKHFLVQLESGEDTPEDYFLADKYKWSTSKPDPNNPIGKHICKLNILFLLSPIFKVGVGRVVKWKTSIFPDKNEPTPDPNRGKLSTSYF